MLNFDRVRGMVVAEARGRLSAVELEDAFALALERIAGRLMVTFRGESMGEWVSAVRQLIRYACMTVQRSARSARGPTQPLERDDGTADRALLEAVERERSERDAGEEEYEARIERNARGRDFLAWAVPGLPPRLRDVLGLMRLGLTTEQIQARLGVSADVVYQSRRRALQTLARLAEEWDG